MMKQYSRIKPFLKCLFNTVELTEVFKIIFAFTMETENHNAENSSVRNCSYQTRGGARHFHLGGPLEGPVLQQGELSMVCVGLSERDLLRL